MSLMTCVVTFEQVMMLNDRIQSLSRLQSVLSKAEDYLLKLPADTPYSQFAYR
jgi:sucrose synthase